MIDTLEDRARACATAAHAGQLYGDRPYTTHLAQVASVARAFDATAEQMAAAWLHDVIEDTPVTRDDLEDQFGAQVAALVWACTGEGASRDERARSIYAKLAATPGAALVKAADRIANVEASLPDSKHMRTYAGEAADFRAAVGDRIPPAMLDRLDRAYRL